MPFDQGRKTQSKSRKRSADPSTVTKHSGIYDGHHAAKHDGIHVIHENDHANKVLQLLAGKQSK